MRMPPPLSRGGGDSPQASERRSPSQSHPRSGAMLDNGLKAQLKGYLQNLVIPVELVASLDDGPKSRELLELLNDIAGESDKVTVRTDGEDARRPSFEIRRVGTDIAVGFAGLPLGHEFTSLVLALLQV